MHEAKVIGTREKWGIKFQSLKYSEILTIFAAGRGACLGYLISILAFDEDENSKRMCGKKVELVGF